MDFEDDIKIDETALDIECLNQPSLMLKYGRFIAEKERQVSMDKMNLDIVRAEIDKDVRTNPEEYGITKITETVVANEIIANEGAQKAERAVMDSVYQLKTARIAIDAIQQKKDMLEALIRLHGQQYFAGPKIPRDLHEEWITKQQAVRGNKAVAEGLQRRSK